MQYRALYFKLVFLLIIIISSPKIFGQKVAVTEDGDSIYVYSNGTWSYDLLDIAPSFNELSYINEELILDTLDIEFTYPDDINKEIKHSNEQFIIKYNDELWRRIPPGNLNEDAEFAFESRQSDIWCVVIPEKTTIPSENLLKIAKNTMYETSGFPVSILKSEVRTVNNAQVIRGVMSTEFAGISFIFDTYYFSNEKGSVQFVVWSSSTIWEQNEDMILDFLNGFIVLNS